MKFLHTSDWHIGKTLKGRSRLDEQRAVLGEIVRIARKEAFDAILVAGDLYETSAPSAAFSASRSVNGRYPASPAVRPDRSSCGSAW